MDKCHRMSVETTIMDDTKVEFVKPPPVYAPLLWPMLNIWEVVKQGSDVRVKAPRSLATLGLIDHSFTLVASFRSFLLSYIIIYCFHNDENPYPAWGRGK